MATEQLKTLEREERCTCCSSLLTPESSVPARRKRNGLSSLCRSCHKDATVRWQKENPEKVRSSRKARYLRMKAAGTLPSTYTPERGRRVALGRYGVTAQWWNETLDRQGGVCAICGGGPGLRHFCIDHDHSCCPTLPACGSCARGLLCSPCNFALAALERDRQWIVKADTYLGGHRG